MVVNTHLAVATVLKQVGTRKVSVEGSKRLVSFLRSRKVSF